MADRAFGISCKSEADQKARRRIRRKADIEDVRIHDLRHFFASFDVGNREIPSKIVKILGHMQIHTTQRYAHLADAPMHEAADRISNTIAEVLGG